MSKKYVIEIKPEYEDSFQGVMLLGAKDSTLYVDTLAVENLEELNSDYINEHYGELQEEAYQKGINDGSLDVKQRVEGAYQRGLEDAWDVVRKIAMETDDGGVSIAALYELFGTESMCVIVKNNTVYEAIDKLKAYEDKHSDRIEVGDEVINNTTGTKGILLEPETEDLLATVVVPNHRWNTFNMSHINLTKTGRHFDIEGILEAMKQE